MIGAKIIQLQRVDSTNGYAEMLLQREEVADGTVVFALEQFAGKGQNDNTWLSEPRMNLTFTVILHPVFLRPDRQFLLNKAVALGVRDWLTSLGVETNIKWPNDILAGNGKIAGILISHKIMGGTLADSVIGIGININQQQFPPDLPNPVSLWQLTGRKHELREALEQLCVFLEKRYRGLQSGDQRQADGDYAAALFGFNRDRVYKRGQETIHGKITGVDDLGRLLLETKDQGTLAFNHKEIEFEK